MTPVSCLARATPEHTPRGRGYASSLGYFHHDNNFWNEHLWATYNDSGYVKQCNAIFVDLWETKQNHTGVGGGAIGLNGSMPTSANETRVPAGCNGTVSNYEEYLFAQRALQIIASHEPDRSRLFLQYDFHVAHEPIQAPRSYFDRRWLWSRPVASVIEIIAARPIRQW